MSWPNGTSDPNAQYQRPPRQGFFDAIRGSGWYRAQNRTIAGVCSGLSARQGWDLTLVRVVMVVATLCMPVVAIAYGLAWLLLPEAADGRIHAEETLEGRFDVAVIGGVFMVLAGLSSALSSIGIVNGVGFGWFQLLALAAAMTAIVVVIVSVVRSASQSGPHRHSAPPYGTPQHGAPQYGMPQYGMPQNHTTQHGAPPYGAPQNHTPQNKTSAMGASAPFDQSAPAAKRSENTMHPHNNTQSSPGASSTGAPAGPAGTPAANSPSGSPDAARASQHHPGWTPPPTAHPSQTSAGWTSAANSPRPRQWTAPALPTHSPRAVSARANLAITGIVVLVFAAVFTGLYAVGEGVTIPYISAETLDLTIARIIAIGGGVCLIVVGLSLAIAALRDRRAGWLTTLSVIGFVFALPTAIIGSQGGNPANVNFNTNTGSANTLDWTVDTVSGTDPTATTVLDLTGAPVGTTKTITVDWRAWKRLTIQVSEGQPIQIVCQSSIDTLSTNMDDDGWAADLDNCSGKTVSSPSWGKPNLGGLTVLIADTARMDTLTIVQSPDAARKWTSAPDATPSPTPSETPTDTPTSSQSGN